MSSYRDKQDHHHHGGGLRFKPFAKWIPATVSDKLALTFTITSIVGTYFAELFFILPSVLIDLNWILFHGIIGTLLFANMIFSLRGLIGIDTSIRSHMLPSMLRPGWHFCHVCESNVPPRSFHCSSCGICILRRDHHCVFSGSCVGYFNMRHYLSFVGYVTLGGLYATVFNMSFVWDLLGGFNINTFFYHLLPFPFFMLGYLSLMQFLCCIMSIINITGSLLCLVLFINHIGLLRSNQTTYERNHRIKRWDLGNPRWNLEECLSERWIVGLVCPMIRIRLPRDGFDFPSRESFATDSSKNR